MNGPQSREARVPAACQATSERPRGTFRRSALVDRGPTGWSARPSSAARSGSARDAGGDSIQAAVAEGEGAAVASSPPPTGKTAVNHPLAPWRRQLI
ncbi:unnamed protein product [Rangifer tarandus platyrhynchus]|uniref:Uncharacterized protein n=2 Tax=Rangifer tarandus platyrhynchus TaxID=3082113 RepID=A0ABN8YR23_RANTA|nr:unnamed protein product [Rangifer tarandus platyrhynchus]CAI9700384.1 unnamed protein product [Rangifer tarandus platyrhynchus]